MREKFNRVLPSNELLSDRWEKARFLDCGNHTSIYDSSVIMGEVLIGSDVWIGPFTLLEGVGGAIKIGDFCHISSGVQIVTHDTAGYVLTGGKAPFRAGEVQIGDHTYIGGMSIVTRGVSNRTSLCNRCKQFCESRCSRIQHCVWLPCTDYGKSWKLRGQRCIFVISAQRSRHFHGDARRKRLIAVSFLRAVLFCSFAACFSSRTACFSASRLESWYFST